MSSVTKPPVRPQPPKPQPEPAKTDLKSPMPEQRAEDGNSREDEVRPLAYRKWEEAGRPPSDGVEFWLAAEMEILRRKKPR